MNKLIVSLLVIGGLAGVVWAYDSSTSGTIRPNLQRTKGGIIASANTLVSGSAELITGVSIACGGTACNASLYDESAVASGAAIADGVFEGGAPANQTVFFNFKDAPIRTKNGIVQVSDSNVKGLVVYTEQNIP